MNTANQSDTTLTPNEDDVTNVDSTPYQLYIQPDTGEIIIPENPKIFDDEWRKLHSYSDKNSEYEALYSETLTLFSKYEKGKIGLSGDEALKKEIVDQCEKISKAIKGKNVINTSSMTELEKSFVDCISQLEDAKFSLKSEWESEVMEDATQFKDMIELLPVKIKDSTKSGNVKSNRFVYLRKTIIEKDKYNKIKITEVKSSAKEGGSTKQGSESFIEKDKHGNVKYNLKKLAKQLSTPEVKAKIAEWSVPNMPEGYLPYCKSWATELEQICSGEGDIGIMHISGGAHFMRYATTAKVSANFDPLAGNVAVKGELSGRIALAEGAIDASIYIPDRLGILWEFSGYDNLGNKKAYPIGNFRAKLSGNVSGFVGASACICGQLSIQLVEQDGQKKQVLAGKKGSSKGQNLQERNKKGTSMYKQVADTNTQGVTVDAAAFAGAKVSIGLSGSLQWLKPREFYSIEDRVEKLASDDATLEFQDFAAVTPAVDLMVGGGGGVTVHCQYVGGKLMFRCHASLCLGVGAKGALTCEVDASLIWEFVKWFAHQLYWANYTTLEYMDNDTFKYLKYMITLVIGFAKSASDLLEAGFRGIIDIFNDAMTTINDADSRLKIANNVIAQQALLRNAPPESKGMLIALLMESNFLDQPRMGGSLETFDGNGISPWTIISSASHATRAKAIVVILNQIQTQREWVQVMKNIELDKIKRDGIKTAEDAIANEKKMRFFLSMGYDFKDYNKEINNHSQELKVKAALAEMYELIEQLKQSLDKSPAYGCAIVPNDSIAYKLRAENTQIYPWKANLDRDKI